MFLFSDVRKYYCEEYKECYCCRLGNSTLHQDGEGGSKKKKAKTEAPNDYL